MTKLAIHGGPKVRTEPFPAYNPIGKEEETATLRVLRSGKLSTFVGAWHQDFLGGTEVRALEEEWAAFFGAKYAVSMNSATSALFAAVGACHISPGDEVIVSPYTMSASAVAPLVYGAIPVFADIDAKTFCLDPASIEKNITSKTRAIVAVDLFGHPYHADAINTLAKKHNLKVIEDCAQAPGAKYDGKFAGTLGDIGIYSLNYHKHIHSGEGGIAVTNDEQLAERLRLIRNHAESVLNGKGVSSREELINMVGFNYRMTEIEAAIAREQLKKLPVLLEQRIENVQYLNKLLANIPCLTPINIQSNIKHAYYVNPILFDASKAGIGRNIFINAVKAELPRTILRDDIDVLITYGYVKPIYLQPMYRERMAFGREGYPFTLTERTYAKGLCPIAEDMHENRLVLTELIRPPMTKLDLHDVYRAFEKVWENRNQLE